MLQSTLKNRTIFCRDNLEVLRGINTESIDLIYLDPPFNKNKVFTAPIGTSAEGASFSDIFKEKDVKEEWLDIIKESNQTLHDFLEGIEKIGYRYNKYYLCYMAIRLIECHRILKDTGSLYLHCDPTMSHYLKLLLDCIFGEKNFKNEIAWCYSSTSQAKKWYPKKHDVILFYSKSKNYYFEPDKVRIPYKKSLVRHGSTWKSKNKEELEKLTNKGKIPEDFWADIFPVNSMAKERQGYPTQKPIALLQRIIEASTNKGDVVLDPFCGCATTCIASEILKRQWIGIDISKMAYKLVQDRLLEERKQKSKKELGKLQPELADPKEIIFRPKKGEEETDILQRTDLAINKRNKTETKITLYGEQKGKCKGCKTLFEYRNLVIDHIQPKSKGGGDNIENLQLLCGACNSQKGTGTMEELRAKLKN